MPDTSQMHSFDEVGSPEVTELCDRAVSYLSGQRWCNQIDEQYLAWALAGVCGVFFFRLTPACENVDSELWVVVGDMPSAYLVCDNAQTWQEALDAYGTEMMEWVSAVRAGKTIEDVIPVNVEPTLEYADMLESRIKTIWESFVDADAPPSDL